LHISLFLKYDSVWNKFQTYCSERSAESIGCPVPLFLEYLYFISEQSGLSAVYTHLSGVSFHHRRLGLDSPSDDSRVKMFMKGLKRKQSTVPVRRAKPINKDILLDLMKHMRKDHSLVAYRTVWRLIINFTCCLRFDDLRRLTVKN